MYQKKEPKRMDHPVAYCMEKFGIYNIFFVSLRGKSIFSKKIDTHLLHDFIAEITDVY